MHRISYVAFERDVSFQKLDCPSLSIHPSQ